ncbi:MAG: type II toxin-antitoxin system VapC family toxin [Dehalococcoidia bacterium]|nr:MAG: type II toxin-antitoxin system VapC family toxin [Dehalococcoidia bacterium]
MRYMLDTNICSYILKNRPLSVKAQFELVGTRALCISTVVLAELYYGAARHPRGPSIRQEIDDFVSRLAVIPWDETAADHYGHIRTAMEKDGTLIGAMDMMIAAHARSQGITLVSNNTRHFEKVPGLLIANWV